MTRSERLWASATALIGLLGGLLVWRVGRPKPVGHALIVTAHEHTTYDHDRGVRSVQEADLIFPTAAVDAIWSPRHLERLARTYWRFLTRVTLGLIQID